MTTWQLLAATWDWEPTVLAGCAALLVAYALFAGPLSTRAWLFGGGVGLLLLALVSPLDTLGDTYLFSAHMLQHLLLIMAVPPLLLLGIPPDLYARILRRRPARLAERLLGRPPVSWLLGICTLWLWHLPALYDAAVRDEGIHILQHLSFLVTSTIFWWPVLTPCAERRLGLLASISYLMAASFASSILGVVITFAPPGLYPVYQQPFDSFGALQLIRQGWGLSYAVDQQVGGLIMWVTGGPVYLLAALLALVRWFREPDGDTLASAVNRTSELASGG
jgi:cytochrome c oxidase assembly factor CtaG